MHPELASSWHLRRPVFKFPLFFLCVGSFVVGRWFPWLVDCCLWGEIFCHQFNARRLRPDFREISDPNRRLAKTVALVSLPLIKFLAAGAR